jgi:hypothetical protein
MSKVAQCCRQSPIRALRSAALVVLSLAHVQSKGDATACEGVLLPSKFHGGEQHCVCPDNARCTGPACSIGHGANANRYGSTVHGYAADCIACACVPYTPHTSFTGMRNQKLLWIVGSHHKTGSFLIERVWGHLRREASPPLKVNVKSFKVVSKPQWVKLSKSDFDVVITFHAEGIGPELVESLAGRPYRFVHLVRDPVEQASLLLPHALLHTDDDHSIV